MLLGMTSVQGNVHSLKETQNVVEDALNSVNRVPEIKRPCLSADNSEGILNATTRTRAHLSADKTQPEMNARGTRTFRVVTESQLGCVQNVKQPPGGENVPMSAIRTMGLDHAAQPAPTFANSLQGKRKLTRTPQLTWTARILKTNLAILNVLRDVLMHSVEERQDQTARNTVPTWTIATSLHPAHRSVLMLQRMSNVQENASSLREIQNVALNAQEIVKIHSAKENLMTNARDTPTYLIATKSVQQNARKHSQMK